MGLPIQLAFSPLQIIELFTGSDFINYNYVSSCSFADYLKRLGQYTLGLPFWLVKKLFWNAPRNLYFHTFNIKSDDELLKEKILGDWPRKNPVFTFNPDNTYILQDNEGPITGTYSIRNEYISCDIRGIEFLLVGDGKHLVCVYPGSFELKRKAPLPQNDSVLTNPSLCEVAGRK